MAKVTINNTPVPDGLADIIATLTRTEKIGNTALLAAPMLGLVIDAKNMTAEFPKMEAFKKMADLEAVVHVEDVGEYPRPRHCSFGDLLERVKITVEIAPLLVLAKELSDNAKGTVIFEGKGEGNTTSKTKSTLDFALMRF